MNDLKWILKNENQWKLNLKSRWASKCYSGEQLWKVAVREIEQLTRQISH